MLSTIQEQPATPNSSLVSFHSHNVPFSSHSKDSHCPPTGTQAFPPPAGSFTCAGTNGPKFQCLCLLSSASPCSSLDGGKGCIDEVGSLIQNGISSRGSSPILQLASPSCSSRRSRGQRGWQLARLLANQKKNGYIANSATFFCLCRPSQVQDSTTSQYKYLQSHMAWGGGVIVPVPQAIYHRD